MKKIVLIEDDLMLGQNLTEILEGEDFEVIHTINGQLGIDLVLKHLPDLVISDILLPEFDGLMVKEKLNKDPLASTIPFIFLTAKADKNDIRRGMEVGADDYLTKPFTKESLLNSINSRIHKNEVFKKHSSELTKSIALALPHEFNNPLISILGYSEIILDIAEKCQFCQCNEIMTYTKIINSSGTELLGLLKRFLLIVKLEMIFSDLNEVKKYNDNKSKFINTEYACDSLYDLSEKYSPAKIDIRDEAKKVKLNISDEDFDLILKEIVDNAFKFSEKNSIIKALLTSDDTYYKIVIINPGRGMSEDQISRIGLFQQFEREKFEQKGLGIGLAIAKKLLELNEGILQISSVPDLETMVTLNIPIKKE
jgi:signal transduction histidine kinase